MFISFIIPAHNEELLIDRCLANLRAAATASGKPFEIIVAADGCTDRTVAIAREAGAIVVEHDRRQIAATRNLGARHANGDALFFIDADTFVIETNIREAFAKHGITEFATVKGWEGSVDLARSRTSIIGINRGDHFERLTLSAKNYGFSSEDPAIADASEMATKIISALKAEPSEYLNSVLWNCGFYLWLYGLHGDITEAIGYAQEIISSGAALQKLQDLQVRSAQ